MASSSATTKPADNKASAEQQTKDAKTPAPAAALEEDDEFEDFPVEGAYDRLWQDSGNGQKTSYLSLAFLMMPSLILCMLCGWRWKDALA